MKRLLLGLCLLASSCQPASYTVDLPQEKHDDWILSEGPGAGADRKLPTAEARRAFREDDTPAAAVHVNVNADDFYGNQLYDGFDLSLLVLDERDRVIRKLGHLSIALYEFEGDTLAGKGTKLMTWHVSAARMAGLWGKAGLDRGYHMKLAWTRRPAGKYVRMEVFFETLDGQTLTELRTPGSIDQPRYRWLLK